MQQITTRTLSNWVIRMSIKAAVRRWHGYYDAVPVTEALCEELGYWAIDTTLALVIGNSCEITRLHSCCRDK